MLQAENHFISTILSKLFLFDLIYNKILSTAVPVQANLTNQTVLTENLKK